MRALCPTIRADKPFMTESQLEWLCGDEAMVELNENLPTTAAPGLLGIGVLFALTCAYVSPALLFTLPAICGLFSVNNCRMVVVEEELAK